MSVYIETHDVQIKTVSWRNIGPRNVEPTDTDPTVDILEDQSHLQGSRVLLNVGYHAFTPVTIIWRVNGVEINRQDGLIPHGYTELVIPRFGQRHSGKVYSVEVRDNRGRSTYTGCAVQMKAAPFQFNTR